MRPLTAGLRDQRRGSNSLFLDKPPKANRGGACLPGCTSDATDDLDSDDDDDDSDKENDDADFEKNEDALPLPDRV